MPCSNCCRMMCYGEGKQDTRTQPGGYVEAPVQNIRVLYRTSDARTAYPNYTSENRAETSALQN